MDMDTRCYSYNLPRYGLYTFQAIYYRLESGFIRFAEFTSLCQRPAKFPRIRSTATRLLLIGCDLIMSVYFTAVEIFELLENLVSCGAPHRFR
jgi:hypothetical protein